MELDGVQADSLTARDLRVRHAVAYTLHYPPFGRRENVGVTGASPPAQTHRPMLSWPARIALPGLGSRQAQTALRLASYQVGFADADANPTSHDLHRIAVKVAPTRSGDAYALDVVDFAAAGTSEPALLRHAVPRIGERESRAPGQRTPSVRVEGLQGEEAPIRHLHQPELVALVLLERARLFNPEFIVSAGVQHSRPVALNVSRPEEAGQDQVARIPKSTTTATSATEIATFGRSLGASQNVSLGIAGPRLPPDRRERRPESKPDCAICP